MFLIIFFVSLYQLKKLNMYSKGKVKVVYSDVDLILQSKDSNVLEGQGYELVKYLPDWVVYEPFPNGGKAPTGSYTTLYSPIFEKGKNDIQTELEKVFNGLAEFMKNLNSNGQTVSRIGCWLEQSNDYDAVPHPVNNIKGHNGTNQKYIDNQDFKFCNWVFDDITKQDLFGEIVYGNRVNREINGLKTIVKKKYWGLHINSSWCSI